MRGNKTPAPSDGRHHGVEIDPEFRQGLFKRKPQGAKLGVLEEPKTELKGEFKEKIKRW